MLVKSARIAFVVEIKEGAVLYKYIFSAAILLSGLASAGVLVFDFETEAERKSSPRLARKTYGFCVTNFCATSGRYAFSLFADTWKTGDYEWPAFTLNPSCTDWSSFDRLVLDVTNLGAEGDVLNLRLAGPSGKPDLGLARSMPLPAWGTKQWVVDLQYWPKETNPTNITRVYF